MKHEVELGVVIGKSCRNVSSDEAIEYIGGYCLGLDLSAFCELVISSDHLHLLIIFIVISTELHLKSMFHHSIYFQGEARKNGLPWSMGKGFDTSNPVSRFISLDEINDLHNVDLYLNVNGERRQTGNTNDLLYNTFDLISYTSKYMTLEPGDLIMTGTPKGASEIHAGDLIEAGLIESGHEIVKITFNVK